MHGTITLRRSLVSGIYRLAPPELLYSTAEESERRLKATMRRLVDDLGHEAVLRRIRAWPAATKSVEETKAWLVLTIPEPHRGGTL